MSYSGCSYIGLSPSGKATDFDSVTRGSESRQPSQDKNFGAQLRSFCFYQQIGIRTREGLSVKKMSRWDFFSSKRFGRYRTHCVGWPNHQPATQAAESRQPSQNQQVSAEACRFYLFELKRTNKRPRPFFCGTGSFLILFTGPWQSGRCSTRSPKQWRPAST